MNTANTAHLTRLTLLRRVNLQKDFMNLKMLLQSLCNIMAYIPPKPSHRKPRPYGDHVLARTGKALQN